MARFYVTYGTGAGDFWFEGDLFDAMKKADSEAAYTCQGIAILSEDLTSPAVAVRPWYGYPWTPAELDVGEDLFEEDFIVFGKFGFYGPWEVF